MTDERPSLAAEPSGDGDGPATVDDEQPSPGRRRFVLPSIDWVRARARAAHAARLGLKLGIAVIVVSVALGTASFVTASFYGQYGAIRNTPNAQSWGRPDSTVRRAGDLHLLPRTRGRGPGREHPRRRLLRGLSWPGSRAMRPTRPPPGRRSSSGRRARSASPATPRRPGARPRSRRSTWPPTSPAGRMPALPRPALDPGRPTADRHHPLADLPECTTCHSPDGLKKIPAGHQIVGDAICLSCHGPAADGNASPRHGRPDDADRSARTRISRRQVLGLGVVAVPCLVGSSLLFDWLTGLTDDRIRSRMPSRSSPATTRRPTAGASSSTPAPASAAACASSPARPRTTCPRIPSTPGPGSSATRSTADGTVFVDSPDGGINGFPAETGPAVAAGATVTDVRFVPRLCMQCENSPCTAVCPVGATYRTADGIVLVDEERCIGCGYCVVACPYGARYIVPAGGDTPSGVAGVADKCTLCYHRITPRPRAGLRRGLPGRAPGCSAISTIPTSEVSVTLRDQPTKSSSRSSGRSRASTTSASRPRSADDDQRSPAAAVVAQPAGRGLRAARAEVARTPRALKAWFGLLLALMAVRRRRGRAHDRARARRSSARRRRSSGALLISAYVFFAITTSGLCLASSLGTVFGIDRFRPLEKRHAILAVLSLTTAFGIIALDLHYPVRMVFGAVLNPSPSSPMWWMGVFYGVYLVFLLVEVWSMFTGHPARPPVRVPGLVVHGDPRPDHPRRGLRRDPVAARVLVRPVHADHDARDGAARRLGAARHRVHVRRPLRARRVRACGGACASRRSASCSALALVGSLVLLVRQVVAGLMSDDAAFRGATMALLSGSARDPVLGPDPRWPRDPARSSSPCRSRARSLGTGIAASLAFGGVIVDRLLFVEAGQIIPTTAVGGVVSVDLRRVHARASSRSASSWPPSPSSRSCTPSPSATSTCGRPRHTSASDCPTSWRRRVSAWPLGGPGRRRPGPRHRPRARRLLRRPGPR